MRRFLLSAVAMTVSLALLATTAQADPKGGRGGHSGGGHSGGGHSGGGHSGKGHSGGGHSGGGHSSGGHSSGKGHVGGSHAGGNSSSKHRLPNGKNLKSGGYYFKGKGHNHWSSRRFDKRYGCTLFWDGDIGSYYYWCKPDGCYYPVDYCPYDTYAWDEDDDD